MPKKGENIYKRKDGRWEGRFIRSHDKHGKTVYGYIYGKTYSEVKQKLPMMKVQPPQCAEKQSKTISYNQLLDEWLCSSKLNVKESTYVRYVHLIQTHIKPHLGAWTLSQLTTRTVESFIAAQLKSGRLDGKGGLSPKTVTDILTVIKSTVAYAEYNNYPVSCNLKKLSVKKKDREMRVLTPVEQAALLETLTDQMDSCKFGVLLSLYTGIRIGELCALKWENLCLQESLLKVRKTMQRIQDTTIGARHKITRWLGELVGKAGEDLTRHDKWLCMMYPRLKLLHKLLADEGAIFISLDDNEIVYLRAIMDEIFGAANFIAQITLLCNPKGRSQDKYFATCHEYLLVYAKSTVPAGFFSVDKDDGKIDKDYKLSDENGKYRLLELRNTHREFGKMNRPNLWYPIYANPANGSVSLTKDNIHCEEIYPMWPDGYEGCWTWGTDLAAKDIHLLLAQKKSGTWKVYRKAYAVTDNGVAKQKLFTIWNNPQFYTEKGQVAFGQIFPGANKNDFPQPKSVDYVMEAIRTIAHDGDIVLDSFAGSGTTGQAVLNLNTDGGNRKFILIEMMDYADSITAERVKRVINGYGEGKNAVEGTGGNFSFYDLGEPLMIGECLNEQVAPEKIREYIWFMETKQPYAPADNGNRYYLGKHNNTGYYFFYEPQSVTVLDYAFLATITEKADGTVIYADRCAIGEDKLSQMGITFKKIPRDISRL